MLSDPIADFLTRIRNGGTARRVRVSLPESRLRREIARVLKENGYIEDYSSDGDAKKPVLTVELRYHTGRRAGTPMIGAGVRGLRGAAQGSQRPRDRDHLDTAGHPDGSTGSGRPSRRGIPRESVVSDVSYWKKTGPAREGRRGAGRRWARHGEGAEDHAQ